MTSSRRRTRASLSDRQALDVVVRRAERGTQALQTARDVLKGHTTDDQEKQEDH